MIGTIDIGGDHKTNYADSQCHATLTAVTNPVTCEHFTVRIVDLYTGCASGNINGSQRVHGSTNRIQKYQVKFQQQPGLWP